MSNLSTFIYEGQVKIKLKIKDKIVDIYDNHNAGLPGLSRMFAKCVVSATISISDTPQYLDLRVSSSDDWSSSTSCLYNKISLSGKYYEFDAGENNWVGKLTGVISAVNLKNTVASGSTENYRLYLVSGGSEEIQLAYLDMDTQTLSNLTPGTQAIIEWNMQLKNVSNT